MQRVTCIEPDRPEPRRPKGVGHLARAGSEELDGPALYVITGIPDDTRRVAPGDRGYDLASHARKFRDDWSRDEHRSFWSAILTLEWPTAKQRTGCVFLIGHRGGSREALAHSVAFAMHEGGLAVDDALAMMGVAPNAGHRGAILGLALEYARCFLVLDGYHVPDAPAHACHRLPVVVTEEEYTGLEWLTGHSTLPYGLSNAYRAEPLAIEAYGRMANILALSVRPS